MSCIGQGEGWRSLRITTRGVVESWRANPPPARRFLTCVSVNLDPPTSVTVKVDACGAGFEKESSALHRLQRRRGGKPYLHERDNSLARGLSDIDGRRRRRSGPGDRRMRRVVYGSGAGLLALRRVSEGQRRGGLRRPGKQMF